MMKTVVVYIDDVPFLLLPGMTVRHVLAASGRGTERCIFDEWGQEVGLDGAVQEGMRLVTKCKNLRERGK
ncbi:MAG: hypothetical protein CSYNP_03831 [Syntrophus sp. SKADARSKE-3]|nr:hypothetical protein [Syntrophus sp. SKADARSKE-3]